MEIHHICPKAKDLFPEYASLKQNPWNKIKLTHRQHFIAHWLLFKTYRNRSTAYSLRSMSAGQKNKHQTRVKSKNYELIKLSTKQIIGDSRKGKAAYKDKNGNIIMCQKDDARVISGELISASLGRKYKWKKESKNSSEARKKYMWKKYPVRKITLFFLDIKITLEYTENNFTFLPYLEQGWQIGQTKEYRSHIAKKSNENMSQEARKRAGEKISQARKQKSLCRY
jgi:hypothetical protein